MLARRSKMAILTGTLGLPDLNCCLGATFGYASCVLLCLYDSGDKKVNSLRNFFLIKGLQEGWLDFFIEIALTFLMYLLTFQPLKPYNEGAAN